MPDTSSIKDFEAAIAELESIVKKLEEGDLALEQSLELYERGVQLSKFWSLRRPLSRASKTSVPDNWPSLLVSCRRNAPAHSTVISRLSDQNRILAQRLALLESRLRRQELEPPGK